MSGRALIVEDVPTRSALAASRALSRAGWIVGVGSPTRDSLAARSRSTSRWHEVPGPGPDRTGFLDAVRAAVHDGRYELVLVAGDHETMALSVERETLGAQFPYAQHELVVRAFDKLHLTLAAQRVGLQTPTTFAPSRQALESASGPFVVKPRLHNMHTLAAAARLAGRPAGDVEQALQQINTLRALGSEPLVQELVQGRLIAVSTVADGHGRLLAVVPQEAEHTWPPGARDDREAAHQRQTGMTGDLAGCPGPRTKTLGQHGKTDSDQHGDEQGGDLDQAPRRA